MDIEGVGGSIVSKILELLVKPVTKQFRYMFNFNNFVQEFNEQMLNMALALHRLQDAVDIAERNVEEIEIDVKKWLEDAKNEMNGVDHLENEKGKIGKCFILFPKWIHQFKLSKALEKKTKTFRKLEEKSRDFRQISHKKPLQHREFLQSKEFTPSESSKEAFDQIMKALKEDNINMIGLYGMGGVGKTTLVKEVGRRVKDLQLFDEVLITTVSQNPNVIDIQDQIADSLGLRFDEKSKKGRADRLWQRLQEKKMLIILDDVWKVINLEEIGIPFGEAYRGCKTLLTTRLKDLCSYMECQQKVLLSLLSENEAWALFKINAGLHDEDSTFNKVAKQVARECQGLPIALVTVGRALRDKSVAEWELASKELKNSHFQHMEEIGEQKNTYACLKLSYDYLKHEKTKLCFLLCCLFPEDYSIPIEDLTRYAVGYGLHQDVESIEDARKQVYVAIKNLKDCCMLLGTETEKKVKMHDLVRDVAIQIASSKEHGFMVKAGVGLKEWPMSNKSFEGCTTISLMGNKLAKLPEGLVCPQLKVLLLELDDDLNVPERFFEGMKEIEVLSLKGGCLSLQSLEFSTNLQSLLLILCECKDLIWLRKLQRLKILGFIQCYSLEELLDEIGELKELRLLDVTGCCSLGRIHVNLIGRLKKLEELLIGDDSFKRWGVVGCDSTGGMNASLTELNLLSHLAVLSLKISRVEYIPRDFVFPRLLKFDIVLGNGYSKIEHPTSTRLYLRDISVTTLNAKTFQQLFPIVSQIGFSNVEGLENIVLSSDQLTNHGHGSQNDFLQRLEDVEVNGCRDIRTLFPAKWQQALKNLVSVEIINCKSLEEVFELGEVGEGIREEKELRLLSSLTRLELEWLPELKCIWKGPTRYVSLQSLIHLELWSLYKLTFIFTPSLAQSLIHLETLRIKYCTGLEHLIRVKDDEKEIILKSFGFPKLKTLSISGCDKLEYVFHVSVSPSLLNLEVMEIYFAKSLKQIFYSGDALTRDGFINFPQLRKLSLSSCNFFSIKKSTAQLPSLQVLTIRSHEELGNLLAQLQGLTNLQEIHITSCRGAQHLMQAESFVPNRRIVHEWWQALKNLVTMEIKNCESLEEVFELDEADEGSSEVKELQLLSSLTRLELEKLPELKCIWKGATRHVSLRSLVHLELRSLDKLTFIFTPFLVQSLVHLQTLRIEYCSGLRYLIREKDDKREIISESLGFPKLKTLFISGCDKLEYVFPMSFSLSLQNLEEMKISYGCNLKQIFYNGEGDAHTRDDIINFPRLRELSISSCRIFGPKKFTAHLPSLQVLAIQGHEELGNLLAQFELQKLTNLQEIHITSCKGAQHLMQAESFVHNRRTGHEWWQALKNLVTMEIKNCDSLEEVFELDEADEGSNEEKKLWLLSSLTRLELVRLPDLMYIWKGATTHVNLRSLVHLHLRSLDKLTFIFTSHLAQSLVHLETLQIEYCSGLKHLIKEKDDEREIIPKSLSFLKLKIVSIIGCDKLEYVFPMSASPSLQNLEEMKISYGCNLKQIFYNGEGDAHTSDCIINFPRLRELSLSSCHLFGPKKFTAQLPSLQVLTIRGHEELVLNQRYLKVAEDSITSCFVPIKVDRRKKMEEEMV
ncbi:hypothetical protein SADUNF_Sadunf16G0261100 [Salix dunnii]|uniref:AAA+ ATPase domain-containing protein n=1 Tax=Salix dunnii TaxID=1413687 RepID=A0A835JE77_9ROSI|nr:hypothetical protein SADUNF_Sadunf16G0261100 [Salix dunnii]